jgi:hypothetical protein
MQRTAGLATLTGSGTSGGGSGRELPAGLAVFEYAGATSLAVIGPVTRRTYFFGATGVRLEVDRRDAEGLRRVPSLVQTRRG